MPREGGLPYHHDTDSNGVRYREFGNTSDDEFGWHESRTIDALVQEALTRPLKPLEIRRLYVGCSSYIFEKIVDERKDTYDLTFKEARLRNWSAEKLQDEIKQLEVSNRREWRQTLRSVLAALNHQKTFPGLISRVMNYIARTEADVNEDIRHYEEELRKRNTSST